MQKAFVLASMLYAWPSKSLLTWPRYYRIGIGDGMPTIREQDRLLPIANVSRIMKRAIPDNGKMAKDSKETMQVGFRTVFSPMNDILLIGRVRNEYSRSYCFARIRVLSVAEQQATVCGCVQSNYQYDRLRKPCYSTMPRSCELTVGVRDLNRERCVAHPQPHREST